MMETDDERLIVSTKTEYDDVENVLRPKSMAGYVGQEKVKENLTVFMQAAKIRGEALDHVLLYGPPGLGKTTLAHIIAGEMGSNIKITSGPSIEKAGDLAAILTNLEANDVLFIDEIHRLNHTVEEILYPAMEDYSLDFIIGKGPSARSVQIPLKPFTLIGATTKAGMLSAPLRDRFGVICRLEMYSVDELAEIVRRSAVLLGTSINEDASKELAKRSRGTPRIANRLVKRVSDFALVKYDGKITEDVANSSLDVLKIDNYGLDNTDRNLLTLIIEKYNGGPVGIETIAAAIGEDVRTIEDVCEPFLLQAGLLQRTPRGRKVSPAAYKHLGFKNVDINEQKSLF